MQKTCLSERLRASILTSSKGKDENLIPPINHETLRARDPVTLVLTESAMITMIQVLEDDGLSSRLTMSARHANTTAGLPQGACNVCE
jgi:hypothetical protein